MKGSSAKLPSNFRRKRWNGEKNLLYPPSIYKKRRWLHETTSVWLLQVIRGTRIHSDFPRVMFFTRIWDIIHGYRSSKSTRFPEGLVLGNWEKTFHPQKVGVPEFVNMFLNMLRGLSWQESILEGALSSFNFVSPLTTCETNYWIGIRIAGLFPISRHLESGEFGKSWTCKLRTFGI
jgi:hypothetical protein